MPLQNHTIKEIIEWKTLDKLKYDTRITECGPLQVTDRKAGRQPAPGNSGPPDQMELIQALQTTKEREADLSEQLRFAHEELRKMNRRMAEAQADNNALSRQLERISMQHARGESPRSTASQVKKEFAVTLQQQQQQQEAKRPEMDENAEKLKAALEEIQVRRETDRFTTKRMNQLANEFLTLKANYREVDWLAKYNEAIEAQKDAENQINVLKRKLAEGDADGSGLKDTKYEPRRRPSLRSSDSRAAMSKDWLLQKLDTYDKEMADLEAEIAKLRSTTSNLKLQSQKKDEEHAELMSEADQRERELRIYIEQLEKKDFVVSSLLELMVQRTGYLQEHIDKETAELTQSVLDSDGELKNLRQLLEKEREKSQVLEDLMKSGANNIPRPMLSENERARLKEIEVLKAQLEEREEQIEDHESQLRDMRSRLERAKKMNEAMKTLIDKDTEASSTRSSVLLSNASLDSKQTALEISSYRREIESMRKEIAILQQKVGQIEKVREKLLMENKDLQEELKLREDSLFDQDDELEKRNADLAKAKRALELMQVELNEARKGLAAARAEEGMSTKISATLAENERLKTELRRLEEELKVSSANLEKARSAETEASEKVKQLTQELKRKDSLAQEKDDLLNEVKKDSQRLDEELNAARKASDEAESKVKKLEATIAELQRLQMKESNGSQWRPDSSPDSGISRDGSRDGRRLEMDRLRRECAALRQERDEIAKEARRDRQMFEKRLQEACNKLNSLSDTSTTAISTSAVSGDLFARAAAEKQVNKKLNLYNEHITKQNSLISQLKIKNEIIQNKVLEYQRRYANLKEQYEAEQEAWLSERVVLESKAKEQEERKNTIASTRKALQEISIKLAETETNFEKERQNFENQLAKLENEKSEIKVQLAQFKEQQKLPKVLQRFSASPARSSHIAMVAAASAPTSAAQTEMSRRLDSAERTIARLKAELQSRVETQSQSTITAIKEAENARLAAECQVECLNEQLQQLNLFREQAELFRERLIEAEQGADREFKIWTEEREDLLCRIEDSRICIEQWCIRLANRNGIEGIKPEEVVNDIIADMERWRTCRLHMPVFQRSSSAGALMTGSHTSDTQSMMCESMIGAPTNQPKAALTPNHRSTSVEWFNRSGNGFRGSTVSLATGVSSSLQRSVTPSFNRCGRSVSPDVSIRKVSNYPDPTPGFLVRSRQTSVESIGSVTDMSQRPFSAPGKPPLRQPISPARRKFFEDSPMTTPSGETGTSVTKSDSFTFSTAPVTASSSLPITGAIIRHPAELRHASTTVASTTKSPTELPARETSLPPQTHKKKESTPSVLSRISSKLTGSKTDLTRNKSPPETRTHSPKQKKKSPPRSSPPKSTISISSSTSSSSTATLSSASSSGSKSSSSPSSSAGVSVITTKRRGSEMIQSIASKLSSAAETSTKSGASSILKTTRSGSLTAPSSTSIAPSIMALRQKFGGK